MISDNFNGSTAFFVVSLTYCFNIEFIESIESVISINETDPPMGTNCYKYPFMHIYGIHTIYTSLLQSLHLLQSVCLVCLFSHSVCHSKLIHEPNTPNTCNNTWNLTCDTSKRSKHILQPLQHIICYYLYSSYSFRLFSMSDIRSRIFRLQTMQTV